MLLGDASLFLALDVALRWEGRKLVGTVTNRTQVAVEDGLIVYDGAYQSIGALAPGVPDRGRRGRGQVPDRSRCDTRLRRRDARPMVPPRATERGLAMDGTGVRFSS